MKLSLLALAPLLTAPVSAQSFCDNVPTDLFEVNNSAETAASINDGLYEFLWVSMVDPDFYRTCLLPGETLESRLSFADNIVELDFALFNAATMAALPTQLSVGCCTVEDHSFTNNTGATLELIIRITVNPLLGECGDYTLELTGSSSCEPDIASFCFGDGGDQMGCTDCPCNNNAPIGSGGGCLHSAGTGAILDASGSGSLLAQDLCLTLSSAKPNSFAVLTSGASSAPSSPANPCFALASGNSPQNLDGLRCVVQSVLRHGPRPIDGAGNTNNPWGFCAANFPNAAFVAGETRYFQVIYREDPGQTCGTDLNSSQGISVDFTP